MNYLKKVWLAIQTWAGYKSPCCKAPTYTPIGWGEQFYCSNCHKRQ